MAGPQGPIGLQGVAGPQGPAGTQGLTGTTGSNGLSAYQVWLGLGNTGTEANFISSLTGPQGPIGVTGPQGPVGAQGTTGVAGPQGPIGLQGVAGPQGPAGSQGSTGADGNSVLNGTTNPTTQGVNGDFYINTSTNTLFGPKSNSTWPSGVSLVGPTGQTGPQGTVGQSAYQLAIANGFQGTEAQWLATLIGPSGTGYKVLDSKLDQNFNVGPNSSISSEVLSLNSSYIIVELIPDFDLNHKISFSFTCFNSSGNTIPVLVEELIYLKSADANLRSDISFVDNNIFNTVNYNRTFENPAGLTGQVQSGKVIIKVFGSQNIGKISFTLSNQNLNSANSYSKSPRVKVNAVN